MRITSHVSSCNSGILRGRRGQNHAHSKVSLINSITGSRVYFQSTDSHHNSSNNSERKEQYE